MRHGALLARIVSPGQEDWVQAPVWSGAPGSPGPVIRKPLSQEYGVKLTDFYF